MCVIIKFRQKHTGLHDVALVCLDGNHLSDDLKSNFGNDLRLDSTNPEDADLDILFERSRPHGNFAHETPICAAAHNDKGC